MRAEPWGLVRTDHGSSTIRCTPNYKCDFDFMQQFNKQEVNIKRLVLDTIFPAFALFLQQKNNSKHSHSTVSRLWATWQWFVPEWINSFKWIGSVAMTHLLTLTYCHLLAVLILHFKVSSLFKIISNISFQRFMFQISKHYLCICNCRLAFCVPLSCIKVCVNTSKCHFRCIAKIHFVDTDFICLVTAQMQEFDSKDDAHF